MVPAGNTHCTAVHWADTHVEPSLSQLSQIELHNKGNLNTFCRRAANNSFNIKNPNPKAHRQCQVHRRSIFCVLPVMFICIPGFQSDLISTTEPEKYFSIKIHSVRISLYSAETCFQPHTTKSHTSLHNHQALSVRTLTSIRSPKLNKDPHKLSRIIATGRLRALALPFSTRSAKSRPARPVPAGVRDI